jgi:hypothetical protein
VRPPTGQPSIAAGGRDALLVQIRPGGTKDFFHWRPGGTGGPGVTGGPGPPPEAGASPEIRASPAGAHEHRLPAAAATAPGDRDQSALTCFDVTECTTKRCIRQTMRHLVSLKAKAHPLRHHSVSKSEHSCVSNRVGACGIKVHYDDLRFGV